jgi:class 3 adenylate cyclase
MSDRRSDAFQRALDEARRRDGAQNDDGSRPALRPRVRAGLEFGPAPSSGGEKRFGLGLDWTGESSSEVGRKAQDSTREDTQEEIAEELGLGATLTPGQLASRWRNFVWRNHPDRQPIDARERANARVAIANTLYDRARRKLAKER